MTDNPKILEGQQQIMDHFCLPWAVIWRLWRYDRLPLVWAGDTPTLDLAALQKWQRRPAQ